ncbi:MAG: UTP--glucose-1-phosphate uridylyltransferase [Clostridiales bacterium]|nr:UTP--glucose-1-phosphate uridylyltransferase [Clostridiales bacterium]
MMKLKKAIIPAAGLGTRFLPITKAVPKPMLSVLDKPTIQYIAEELDSIGIEDIVIVVSPDSDVIERHFGRNERLEQRLIADNKTELIEIEKATRKFNVQFVTQHVPNGLAGAILCAEPYVGDQPFALLLGDELLYAEAGQKPCMKRLAEIFEDTGKSVIATMEVFGDDLSKYGNIGIESEVDGVMQVNAIKEKPSVNEALSNNAIIGRYVMSGKVMGMLKDLKPKGNELYFTDALDRLAENGELLATCFEGERYDVGDKLGYIKANVEIALKSEEIGTDVAEYVKELSKRLK